MQREVTPQQTADIKLLTAFITEWCHGHRHTPTQTVANPTPHRPPLELCSDCMEFLHYAVNRRLLCPLEENKPSCKHCPIHCYAPQKRELIKQIMAWSGRRLILRGRLDYLWHYLR